MHSANCWLAYPLPTRIEYPGSIGERVWSGFRSLVRFPAMPHKPNTGSPDHIPKMLLNVQNWPQRAYLSRHEATTRPLDADIGARRARCSLSVAGMKVPARALQNQLRLLGMRIATLTP